MILWFKLDYSLEDAKENDRFHLVWKINYILLIAMIALAIFSIDGHINDAYLYAFASLIPLANLVLMYKTKLYKFALWFICLSGLSLPFYTLLTFHEMAHFGDILWLMVTVSFAHYGLGVKIGRIFLAATIVIIGLFIGFALDENINKLLPFVTSSKIALFFELTLAIFIIFTIMTSFTELEKKYQKKIGAINDELEDKNLMMQAQNNEKEILLKEIHHRVKNNLQIVSSLLNLQTKNTSDQESRDTLQEGRERIMTLAMLHQMLYQSDHLDSLDLKEYTLQLIDHLKRSFVQDNCSFEVEIENIILDIDTTLSLGLIMNELLTNSFKYCLNSENKVVISCIEKSKNNFQLIFRDNGPGLPEGLNFEKTDTLGLKLVSLLSRQIHGVCEYSYNSGAQFVINFTNLEERKSLD